MLSAPVGHGAAPGPAWLSPPRTIPWAVGQGCSEGICCSLVAADHFQSRDDCCVSPTFGWLHPLGPGGPCCHLGTDVMGTEDMSGFVLDLEGPSWPLLSDWGFCPWPWQCPQPGARATLGWVLRFLYVLPGVSLSLNWAAACACGLWGEHLQLFEHLSCW